jgi:hypothetical protein
MNSPVAELSRLSIDPPETMDIPQMPVSPDIGPFMA